MPVAASDFPFQLILLFVAGLIWAVGKIATASKSIRHRARMKMERLERRRTMQFEERSDYTAPMPKPTLEREPARERLKTLPAEPGRRPPRTKKRIVRRRVIRRIVHKAQPQRPAGVRAHLRDRQSLRTAIVLREILGPPKALRGQRMR